MFFFFFFNDTATTEIYTLSLHDALPISAPCALKDRQVSEGGQPVNEVPIVSNPNNKKQLLTGAKDRKSTRLNSSHLVISYAVFCLKKKNKSTIILIQYIRSIIILFHD